MFMSLLLLLGLHRASELSKFLEVFSNTWRLTFRLQQEKESELEMAQLQLKQSRMQLQSEEEKVSSRHVICPHHHHILQTPIITPASPTGISNEKHMELLEAMNLLQEELRDLQINASHNEATIRKLSQIIIILVKMITTPLQRKTTKCLINN